MVSFIKVVLVIDLIILILGYWPARMADGSGHYAVLVLACILTTLNVIQSYHAVLKSMHVKSGAGIGTVFGWMGIRLILLLCAVFAVIFLTDLPQISFIIGLFICYLSKSVAEIIFINRTRNQSLSSS